MRALVTGSEGFVGQALCKELEQHGYDVIRCSLEEGSGYYQLDVLDKDGVSGAVKKFDPDIIFHLAGQANVALSWKKVQLTMELNINGMVNILEAVRDHNPSIRVIGAGSSDEYGITGNHVERVSEEHPLNPVTPYAVSKAAQEKTALIYAQAHHMNVCMVRCFNLCGPGQNKGFMVSDFASGIAEIENGKSTALSVGNLNSRRDYSDVRDAAGAYRLIGEKGKAGTVYNICSGKAYSAGEILDLLCKMSKCDVQIQTDPERMRPSDTPVICGDNSRLSEETGWKPQYSIESTLKEVLEAWRQTAAG